MRVRRIVKAFYEWVPLESGLNDSALHSPATAVNQPYFLKARLVRGVHVLFHDRFDVLRTERVEIDRILDRYRAWCAVVVCHLRRVRLFAFP